MQKNRAGQLVNFGFEAPWILLGLLLMVLPLVNTGVRVTTHPWIALLPPDPLSTLIATLLRLLGMLTVAALVFGLSGVYLKEQQIERIGNGAHIVLLLDRSTSMDNTFAGQAANGSEESKSAAAQRLLKSFVDQRKQDRIGVAEYSTSPLFVMPLTENKEAVQAAIAATATPALAYTHISKGLSMALSFFDDKPLTGSRIVLLVSDGAAVVDQDSEMELRKLFKEKNVRLYWVFLRTLNNPGINSIPESSRDDTAEAMPERYLHLFFSSLNIPYQAYEAESPDAMKRAINDINQLENQPLHYYERIPKQDLSGVCYQFATVLLALLLGLKFCEAK